MDNYSDNHTTLIKEYGEYLDDLLAKNQDVVFLNSSAKHASMVISRIFKHSQKEVLIRAKDLKSEITKDNDYIIELISFIKRGGLLRILLNEYTNENPPEIFKLLEISASNQVEIKQTNVNFLLKESGEIVHFTVGTKTKDDISPSMYRLEHDTSNFLATGNFNDSKIATNLYNQFYLIFNSDRSKLIASY